MSRCFGATRLTTLPPMLTSPSVISSSPAIIRSKVDLPHPEGPTRTQNSPSAISMSTPRITCVEPKLLRTALMLTAAILLLRKAVMRTAAASGTPTRVDAVRPLRPHNPAGRSSPRSRCFVPPSAAARFPLCAEIRDMRRQDHLGVAQQPALGSRRLDRQDIQSSAGKYSTIECVKQMLD